MALELSRGSSPETLQSKKWQRSIYFSSLQRTKYIFPKKKILFLADIIETILQLSKSDATTCVRHYEHTNIRNRCFFPLPLRKQHSFLLAGSSEQHDKEARIASFFIWCSPGSRVCNTMTKQIAQWSERNGNRRRRLKTVLGPSKMCSRRSTFFAKGSFLGFAPQWQRNRKKKVSRQTKKRPMRVDFAEPFVILLLHAPFPSSHKRTSHKESLFACCFSSSRCVSWFAIKLPFCSSFCASFLSCFENRLWFSLRSNVRMLEGICICVSVLIPRNDISFIQIRSQGHKRFYNRYEVLLTSLNRSWRLSLNWRFKLMKSLVKLKLIKHNSRRTRAPDAILVCFEMKRNFSTWELITKRERPRNLNDPIMVMLRNTRFVRWVSERGRKR